MGYSFSLLLLSKSAAETILNTSEVVLLIAGLVLAFGAIGEYLEEHEKLPRWMKWPKFVFIFMVVVSLVLELFSDAGVFFSSRSLQTTSDREFAGLNKKAGEADERSKKLDGDNIQLGIALETLKGENLKLEALIQPRDLIGSQRRALAVAIERLADRSDPDLAITIFSYPDAEALRLASQIEEALTGIRVIGARNAGPWYFPVSRDGKDQPSLTGVQVVGSKKHERLVSELKKAFTLGGLLSDERVVADVSDIRVYIVVGEKPLPVLRPAKRK